MDLPSGRPRAPRVRIAATTVVAALVPFVWWGAFLSGADWEAGAVQMAARMALLSTLFWGFVAAWFVSGRWRPSAIVAALIGLCSPICCCGLAVPVGLVMLPADFVLGAPAETLSLAWLSLNGMIYRPLWIFPVGLGMGLVAYAIATAAPGRPGAAADPIAAS